MKYVVVPLGNPGKEYETTRHNAARVVVSALTEEKKSLSDDFDVFVPETFMNENGKSLLSYLSKHKDVTPIVMYDDKDLPIGTFRIAYDRGDGGHNGLLSVINAIGGTFVRIRIGIAPITTNSSEGVVPPHGKVVRDYVLEHMNDEEMGTLRDIVPEVGDAIACIVANGYQKAMEVYNAKQK